MLALGIILPLLILYIQSADGLFWIARFEIQVGMLFAVTLFFEIIFSATSLRYGILGYSGGVYMPIKMPITIYAIVASGMYMAFPFSTIEGEKAPIGASFAISMFLIAILDWIFFDEKGTVKVTSAFYYLIYPFFYLIFNIFRPIIFGETAIYHDGYAFPYQFLDPANGIIVTGVLSSLIALVLFGFLMIFFNNLLSGRYRKVRPE